MLNLFNKLRLCLFAVVFVGASIVLGICGYLTSRLASTGIHDFLIFSLVISAFTIVVVVLLALRSQPRIDAIVLFILVALWLTMGAYSQDIIGHQFCYALRGQTIPARNGTMSAENYCRRMKTVLAFSWAIFVFLALWLVGLLILVIKIYARGNRDIWGNSMSDVTLFTESPINKPEYPPMAPATNLPTMPGQTFVYYPNTSAALQPQVIQQQPGHSVIIRNGQVTQVPGSVVSA
ncbi:transmembrane protein, putative [Rhizoctonia solani AG-3 Rhs1AP]|uniref:Transmembrane protein, putative n=2 Tax=Rhizoctonia solani AG-3 TaxID=1086053 RepID=X8J936_9AGAM|nr:transmembrane protein, putative [Rhizoctonia solani AG-3 Rhs1AP]KEP50319.1 putative transmembrane protein [Rhizoctonia solani 123E]